MREGQLKPLRSGNHTREMFQKPFAGRVRIPGSDSLWALIWRI
jgi:hypothetical protein